MQIERFTIWQFFDDVLVKCSRCAECAHLLREAADRRGVARLVCGRCGLTREFRLLGMPQFRAQFTVEKQVIDLWLQTRCCGETLWCLNLDHLDFLEELVNAQLRERRPDPVLGHSNRAIESRLPKWILAAKNRDQVAVGLRRLRSLAPTASA